eukprot:scaffold86858_cov36-Prasinocladus_malaysianus.AAC.1
MSLRRRRIHGLLANLLGEGRSALQGLLHALTLLGSRSNTYILQLTRLRSNVWFTLMVGSKS